MANNVFFSSIITLRKLKNISTIQQCRFLLIIELSLTTKTQLVNSIHAMQNIDKYDWKAFSIHTETKERFN